VTLADLLLATGGQCLRADPGLIFSDVATDSRKIATGALFVALQGESYDGHSFVAQAFEAGAAGALVARAVVVPDGFPLIRVADTQLALGRLAQWHRAKFDLPVVAVTGSVGKTTTKVLIDCVLRAQRNVLTAPASFNNEVGVPLTLLKLDASHEVAVLELAMRGRGQLAYLAELARPRLGVITNLGESHLELLGSREAIADAKAELLEALPSDGYAVLNRDDRFFDRLCARAHCPVTTFGLSELADVRATDLVQREGAMHFVVHHGGETSTALLPAPGEHNVRNALAAVAVGRLLGLSLTDCVAGLRDFMPPAHRLRVFASPRGVTVIDDCYNASPDSVAAALQVMGSEPLAGRRVFVFGDMKELGDRSEAAHREVGALAVAAGVAWIVTVGDLAQLAAREAQRVAPGRIATTFCDTPVEALAAVRAELGPGDLVLVKASRAMKLESVVDGLLAE